MTNSSPSRKERAIQKHWSAVSTNIIGHACRYVRVLPGHGACTDGKRSEGERLALKKSPFSQDPKVDHVGLGGANRVLY